MEKTSSRWWDIPSALILFLAVLFSAWRLQTTDWTEGLGHVRNVAIAGFIVGLALGQSRFQKRGVFWLTLGYMLVTFIWQWLRAIGFNESETYLGDRLLILFGRLFTDLKELSSGRSVEDQFFVMMLLCIPFWFASLYGGYQLTRHASFLASVLPNGILMFLIHIYHYTTRDYTWMIGAYLFLALMLLSRQKYQIDRRKWSLERVQVSSDSSIDITNTTVIVAAALVVLAWGVPYVLPSTANGREFWQNTSREWFSGDRFEKMFASVNKESQPIPRNFQTQMSLGVRVPQSDLVVFQVYVPSSAQDFPRLYWRGQVFDHYENESWQTTGREEIRKDSSGGDFDVPDLENRERLGFTFDVFVDGQIILYTPSQPIWVNHDSILLHSKLSEDTEEDDPILDVMALRASPNLEAGDVYRASALLADPIIPELQQAGEDYPEWVTEKYLQLPADFSPRIRALANEIAAPYDTPYDKTSAITEYLRNTITYASTISFPDESVDQLEYFLFESQRGFCNYSASAEVLMLRSIGIPARLAVGYAQGEPNLQNSIYVVRERDLHAWPEVYFPGYGWIEFEPTGNQDPLDRPEEREVIPETVATPSNPIRQLPLGEEETPPIDPLTLEKPSFTSTLTRFTWVLYVLGGVLFVLTVIFLKQRYAPNVSFAFMLKRAIERSGWDVPAWLNRWLVFANLPSIERYFHSVNASLGWLGRPQPVHATAAERARALQKLLPAASDSIEALLVEHQSQLFRPQGGSESTARRAAWDILYKTARERLNLSAAE
ncbi:MAG: transglutaminase domain-containing protein [Anaerolineales bacterium]|nr:transglutaminase domain-containing protein [Anaerolineales bacterium]